VPSRKHISQYPEQHIRLFLVAASKVVRVVLDTEAQAENFRRTLYTVRQSLLDTPEHNLEAALVAPQVVLQVAGRTLIAGPSNTIADAVERALAGEEGQ